MVDTQQLAISNFALPRKISVAWWAVISRFLLHGLIVSTWVSRIPAVQGALELSNASLGLCLLGTAIGSVCAIPVAGWCITKFGSKQIAAWSTVGFSLALAGPSFATGAHSLFVALLFFGAMAERTMSRSTHKAWRLRMLSVNQACPDSMLCSASAGWSGPA